LANKYEGNRFNSPNDVIVGPDGAIYFTDPTLYLVKGEKQEISFQGVYRLDEKRAVRLVADACCVVIQKRGKPLQPDSPLRLAPTQLLVNGIYQNVQISGFRQVSIHLAMNGLQCSFKGGYPVRMSVEIDAQVGWKKS